MSSKKEGCILINCQWKQSPSACSCDWCIEEMHLINAGLVGEHGHVS